MGLTRTKLGSIFDKRPLYTLIIGIIWVTSNFGVISGEYGCGFDLLYFLDSGFYFLILFFLLCLRCTPVCVLTQRQGKPFIPFNMELERTLIYNQRMVNEGVHNLEYPLEGIYGDATIINQPSY